MHDVTDSTTRGHDATGCNNFVSRILC